MLIPSNFMLNQVSEKYEFEIYPFIHQRSNILNREDQFRSIKIPDVLTNEVPEGVDFSMVAGDFIELYSNQPNSWDAITTCFFIDTAKNIFEYIETIAIALKDEGYWINFGPLLYHFAEMPGEFSIELSYDELRSVIIEYGFEIIEEKLQNCTYSSNQKSMFQMSYKCVFFVAKKKKGFEVPKGKKFKKEPLLSLFNQNQILEDNKIIEE